MIEMLMRLGFAVACGIGAMAAVIWVLVILPEWLRLRRERRQAEEAEPSTTPP